MIKALYIATDESANSGNRTTRRQTNSRSVKSRTGQLAD